MRDWIVGQGVILYILTGCLIVGLLSAFMANHGYKKMIRESEIMGNTQNRLLKYIKLKFGSYYKLNMRPQDTRALTRHYMYKCKTGFLSVTTWIQLSKLAAGAIGIVALGYMLFLIWENAAVSRIATILCCALIGVGLVYIQHRVYDFSEKRDMLEWYLLDYLENFLKNKIESGTRLQAENASDNGNAHRMEDRQLFNEDGKLRMDLAEERENAASAKKNPGADGGSEAAASRVRGEAPEDEIDAGIVSDILKEFL